MRGGIGSKAKHSTPHHHFDGDRYEKAENKIGTSKLSAKNVECLLRGGGVRGVWR